MLREFFGSSIEDAVEKAAWKLKVRTQDISYSQIPGTFSRLGKPSMVGILVDCEKIPKGPEACEAKSDVELENVQEIEDPQEKASRFLLGVFSRMGLSANVRKTVKGENLVLSVEFPDGQIDIRRAEARELRGALQFLVNRVLYGQSGEETRVIVDFGGKLEERTEQMKDLARELAEKVSHLQKPLNIYMMDSQDRRLVHLSFAEETRVKASGRGEERFRILTIEPAGPTDEKEENR
ncbi:MAG: hypothetical protein GYA21_12820 [Myxococcales bacterium]|nr:hypothetical protein [Myxococcales bacterium]